MHHVQIHRWASWSIFFMQRPKHYRFKKKLKLFDSIIHSTKYWFIEYNFNFSFKLGLKNHELTHPCKRNEVNARFQTVSVSGILLIAFRASKNYVDPNPHGFWAWSDQVKSPVDTLNNKRNFWIRRFDWVLVIHIHFFNSLKNCIKTSYILILKIIIQPWNYQLQNIKLSKIKQIQQFQKIMHKQKFYNLKYILFIKKTFKIFTQINF